MGWSTSQLAELAGTTLRAVRHYHEVGLLAEPERRSNGYKSYGVAHLVRVLKIKRLTGLGLSLAQIAELGEDDEHPREVLDELDAELAANIERLQRVREDLAVVRSHAVPIELPPHMGRAVVDAAVSAADRSLAAVLNQVLGQEVLETYSRALTEAGPDPVQQEFDRLPADADEATRQDLAERMRDSPQVVKMRETFPEVEDLCADSPRGKDFAMRTIGLAVVDIYSPAQIDVLLRMNNTD
ncbi:MerR family transcriptional regulator [Allokutzneria multivorans]|uniref:MerR family transcriptional regulator n=1 Tax=Allokutzneria multivorans TaxID=1142134 RepID=A0ABP7SHW6_9PSEU